MSEEEHAKLNQLPKKALSWIRARLRRDGFQGRGQVGPDGTGCGNPQRWSIPVKKSPTVCARA